MARSGVCFPAVTVHTRSGCVVVADRRFRLKGLARGEVALYDDQGQSVTLTRAGIVVNGGGQLFSRMPLKHVFTKCRSESTGVSGTAGVETMAEMRATYNGHTRKRNGDGGGITDKLANYEADTMIALC